MNVHMIHLEMSLQQIRGLQKRTLPTFYSGNRADKDGPEKIRTCPLSPIASVLGVKQLYKYITFKLYLIPEKTFACTLG